MRGDDERRGREDAIQGLLVVDQHVPGARAHEDLDAARLPSVDRLDRLQVVVGGAKVEPVIRHRPRRGAGMLVCERLGRHRLRIGVRHLEIARDATGHRGARLGFDGGLVLESRLAKVHLVVDHPGQHIAPLGIDDLRLWRADNVETDDAPPSDREVALPHRAFVDDPCVDDAVAHRTSLVAPVINAVAFGRRCIPPRGVARRSNTAGVLPPRAYSEPSAVSADWALGA